MKTRDQLIQERYSHYCDALASHKQVQLVVVTKYAPIESIQTLVECGHHSFGESRVQDWEEKAALLPDVDWHFIGRLQRNKVRHLIGRVALIHSVASYSLAKRISDLSLEQEQSTSVLLQVNPLAEAQKQGFSLEECEEFFSAINSLKGVEVKGLMAMAPLTDDWKVVRSCFRQVRQLRDRLGLQELSMGMSRDWQIAVEEGATIIRLGSGILQP